MTRENFAQLWINPRALVNSYRAPSAEAAARWRIDGRGHIALQNDALAFLFGIWNRDRGQQRLRVWMQRECVKLRRSGNLYNPPKVRSEERRVGKECRSR